MLAFIQKTIRTAPLHIRSQLAKAGAHQGANCLNSLWIDTALCSDKCLLCSPEKSDLLKPSRLPLFSLTLALLPPQTTEFGRFKHHFTCQLELLSLLLSKLFHFLLRERSDCVITLETGGHFEKRGLCDVHSTVGRGLGSRTC